MPRQLELLDKLSEITPGHYSHGFFGSSGTEVIEAALRLAHLTTGRRKIIGMEYSYHGMSIAAISITGIPYSHNGAPSEFADAAIIPYDNLEAAAAAIDEDTAAVILEPIQWAAGCRTASTDYLQGLRRLCDERGVILTLDEIQTGMGHTGPWFASERAQIVPDITVIGKTLSGGTVPVAAIMYNDRIAQAESQIPMFLNSTFAGNPLACTAALATIQAIQDGGLLKRVEAISRIIDQRLPQLLQEYPDILTSHNGLGLMRCLIAAARSMVSCFQCSCRKNIRFSCRHFLTIPLCCACRLRISPAKQRWNICSPLLAKSACGCANWDSKASNSRWLRIRLKLPLI